jgi:CRISPR-associated protein Cas5h
MKDKKTIITYGTFDMFHIGHLRLLQRLSKMADTLIVAVSTDEFNGIKFALSSNMHIKDGYQNSSEKKQFYRELICSPAYSVFVDLSNLSLEYQERIKEYLKAHKTKFTPYLGINFCIANFEWIEIENISKIEDDISEIDTFTLKDDFDFDIDNYGVKLTTANMACGVEEGRVFKDFKEFIIEIGAENRIKSKNRGNIYQINENRVYFV